ncbi:MAG: glycosyltransferase family 2 protein [Lachnospiraceae bacterium]|nr:glycosyltransferase family 2 protein [Lachnospiraceae bacterium]
MDVKISVVIPMYNGSKSIEKCIYALDRQTMEPEYEVLIVDDASTDDSLDKVRELVRTLNRKTLFQVIACEQNGRAGSARNIGIQRAKGEYVLFIDQDDYPDEKMLKSLYDMTKAGSIDCVSCNVGDKKDTVYQRTQLGIRKKLSVTDRLALMKGHGYVFAMLIRRQLILKHKLFFPTNVMFEDSLYNFGVFLSVSSFANVNEPLYIRSIDENSQTAYLNEKKIRDRIRSTKWYMDNYFQNVDNKEYMDCINGEAFYYIYLSCAWWTCINKNLRNRKLFLDICKSAEGIPVDFRYIKKKERRYSKAKLLILQILYRNHSLYSPASKVLCQIYSYMKRKGN